MKTVFSVCASFFAAAVLSGCCLKYSDLSPGTVYPVGSTFSTSSTSVKVEQFQWGNGTWTSTGFAKVDNRNRAAGSGNDVNTNNANLNFQFDYPLKKITLRFGEYGGNNNIKVNNDFRNVANLNSLGGATIGGVQVTVAATPLGGNWLGDLTLEGTIHAFSIGGQELWVDDVCPTK